MAKNPFKIESDLGGIGDLTGKYNKDWVEGSFDIEDDSKGKLSISHTRKYVGTGISQKRINILLFFVLFLTAIIFGRVFQLQIINGHKYRNQAEGNRIRLIPIASERGIIYDRYNRDLLKNIPNFSLVVVPQDLPKNPGERGHIINRISEMSGVTTTDLVALIKKYGDYSFESLAVQDNLDYFKALKLYVENSDLPGVQVESGSRRGYYFLTATNTKPEIVYSLSHLIGYVGKLNDEELSKYRLDGYLSSDLIGKTGLEKSYEKILRGTYGKKKIEVNAIGKEQSVLATEAPIPGSNLILSIDLDAQKKLESLVSETANISKKRKISAIAMNPSNGEILAMVSWPSFDNNLFAGGIREDVYSQYINDEDRPLFNRTISGQYPPGSTIKLIMSAAALQEGIITKNTTVNSVGGIEVGKSFFKDWKAGGHGITNVTKAIAWSVNTFYYYIGGGFEKFIGLGIDRIDKYFAMFGLGQKTNIDLPGESTGFVPSKDWKRSKKNEQWFVGDTYNVSIGQGDMLVSPLQVAAWTAAVANGGDLVTPHLGKEMVDPLNKKSEKIIFDTKHIAGVSDANLKIVREGMRECVVAGSCGLLRGLAFPAAGKTGTAQWSKTKPTHAWFTSFAPYNKPQIVVTVLVEDGGEGSVIAQPIAQKFLDWWGKKYLE
ncbi:MAG: penicillin-binding protein 2 [Patescibacteria group bacterium]|jgi:penicillin-binding protein 2